MLHCVDEDAPEGPTPCSVSIDLPSESGKQHSALLRTYVHLDPTNKVRDFITTLRGFVKDQGIVGQMSGKEEINPCGQQVKTGCLSTYAWTVLAIHVLLKFQLLPNIHSHITTTTIASEEDSAEKPSFTEKNVPENVMSTRPCRQNIQNNILYNKIMKKSSAEHTSEIASQTKEASFKKEDTNFFGSYSPAESVVEVEKTNNLKVGDDVIVHELTQDKDKDKNTDNEDKDKNKENDKEKEKEKDSVSLSDVKEGKSITDGVYVCSTYAEKLSSVSVLDLFHLFFAYVGGSVDVFGTVLTLRGEGEVRYHL